MTADKTGKKSWWIAEQHRSTYIQHIEYVAFFNGSEEGVEFSSY
jgi:hypothetical protein